MKKYHNLIERLADKTPETLYRCNRVWESWNIGTMTEDDFEEVIIDSILIGDALDYIKGNLSEGHWLQVLHKWQPLGFTKSLQEILEENTERRCEHCNKIRDEDEELGECCNSPIYTKQLTPQAQKLYDYLIEIL